MPCGFRWRFNHLSAASTAVSCVCSSLSLPWPVHRPAVAMGRFLTLDLVVRCSSTSGAVIEFWCPWDPLLVSSSLYSPATGKPLGLPRFFEVMDPVFFLPLLVAPSLEAPQRVPASLLRLTTVSLAFELAIAVFCGGGGFLRGH